MDIAELNAKLLDAKVAYEAVYSEMETACKALKAYVTYVLEKNIDLNVAKVKCYKTSAIIEVGNHTIDLCFAKQWRYDEVYARRLTMNFNAPSAFGKDDVNAVHYCEVLGHLAGIMDVLEHQMFLDPEGAKIFDMYDKAHYECWKRESEMRSIEADIEKIEKEENEKRMRNALVEGAKILVRKADFYHPAVIKTIDHVMCKNFIFVEDYGHRTNIDMAINNLLTGKWAIS